MPSEDTKTLEFNQYRQHRTRSIIYPDLESLIKRIDECKINFGISYATKLSEHTPYMYSVSTILRYDGIKNKNDAYRGGYCMK